MTEYSYKTCPVCGIQYAVDSVVMDYKLKTDDQKQRSWFCPNGHNLVFREYESDKMRRERDRAIQEQARLAELHAAAVAERDKAERALKRHKKRSAAGSCPCCKRTFANMAEHMKTQHPEFVAEAGAKVVPMKRRG